jgi:hypothetical protein
MLTLRRSRSLKIAGLFSAHSVEHLAMLTTMLAA